jgi:diguanylate cyclase (GGDEF)-like protein
MESVLLVVALNIAVAMLFQERVTIRLKRAAETDALTGLMNRQSLAGEFERVMTHSDPHNHPSVALLDLDGFKEVNDTLGHHWGDRLLIAVAHRLRETVQGHGSVARLGGDEFAFVFNPDHNDRDHARSTQALLEALRTPFPLNGAQVRLSASIGVSPVNDARTGLAEHLRRADIAMYEAKSRGRDACVHFAPSLDETVQQATWMRAELRNAVESNDLRLVYQPKYDISGASPTPVGMEALLRWTHPQRGPISPSAFIPVAEQTGLIHLIGARILMQACCEAQAMGGVAVAVNLSPAQFDSTDLVATVAQALRVSGLNPACLELEITEGVYLNDTGNVHDMLTELRSLGVRLALDDFGTGYSSLSYLTRLPFDTLKIDRSFVRDCVNRPDAQAVMASVMQLAHAIRLDVVAEGVETEEELACVKALGCPLVQGHLLSAPLERAAIEQTFIAFTDAPAFSPKPRVRA